MPLKNKEQTKKRKPVLARPMPSPPRSAVPLVVAYERQTPEQRHRLHAAVDALLVEMVRQEIGRGKGH